MKGAPEGLSHSEIMLGAKRGEEVADAGSQRESAGAGVELLRQGWQRSIRVGSRLDVVANKQVARHQGHGIEYFGLPNAALPDLFFDHQLALLEQRILRDGQCGQPQQEADSEHEMS